MYFLLLAILFLIFRRTFSAIWRIIPFRKRAVAARREVVHTFYDELSVAKNAPFEVIRASYKALAQIYHPDKNPSSLDGSKKMKAINEAYEVLSDEQKRTEHDLWIAEQATGQIKQEPPTPQEVPLIKAIWNLVYNYCVGFIVIILGGIGFVGIVGGWSEILPSPWQQFLGVAIILWLVSFWFPVWSTIKKLYSSALSILA